MNLWTLMLRSLKVERCDVLRENRSGAGAFQNKNFSLVLLLLGTGQRKTQTAGCRLQTGGKMQTEVIT